MAEAVIDDYTPLSIPPRAGVAGPLAVLRRGPKPVPPAEESALFQRLRARAPAAVAADLRLPPAHALQNAVCVLELAADLNLLAHARGEPVPRRLEKRDAAVRAGADRALRQAAKLLRKRKAASPVARPAAQPGTDRSPSRHPAAEAVAAETAAGSGVGSGRNTAAGGEAGRANDAGGGDATAGRFGAGSAGGGGFAGAAVAAGGSADAAAGGSAGGGGAPRLPSLALQLGRLVDRGRRHLERQLSGVPPRRPAEVRVEPGSLEQRLLAEAREALRAPAEVSDAEPAKPADDGGASAAGASGATLLRRAASSASTYAPSLSLCRSPRDDAEATTAVPEDEFREDAAELAQIADYLLEEGEGAGAGGGAPDALRELVRQMLDAGQTLRLARAAAVVFCVPIDDMARAAAVAAPPHHSTPSVEELEKLSENNANATATTFFSFLDFFPYVGAQLAAVDVPVALAVMPREKFEHGFARCERAFLTPLPLQVGDHIYREIKPTGVLKLVQHHGLYVGDGQIVHFSGNENALGTLLSGRASIKITPVQVFLKHGSRLKLRRYKRVTLSPAETVRRATEALSTQTFPEYSVLTNNCEHFCEWAKTGTAKSNQVRTAATAAAATAAVLAAATAIALLGSKRS